MAERPRSGTIGRYEIVRSIEGQEHELYHARDCDSDGARPRFVLLALFELGPEDARKLEKEVERCRPLVHPAVTRLVELFEHDGKHVLVYEAIPSMSLARLMRHLAEEGSRLAD